MLDERALLTEMCNRLISCNLNVLKASNRTLYVYLQVLAYHCCFLIAELRTDVLVSQWKDVIMFFCLRLLLGPVIESLILLDRYLYLAENGMTLVFVDFICLKMYARYLSYRKVFWPCTENFLKIY